MPQIQNLDLTAGEDRTLTLYARNPSNVPLSLSAATISWRVGRAPFNPNSNSAVFTKTGTVTSAANGIFTVPVTPSDTQYLQGDYEHEAWATISTQVSLVTRGRFRVLPYITV